MSVAVAFGVIELMKREMIAKPMAIPENATPEEVGEITIVNAHREKIKEVLSSPKALGTLAGFLAIATTLSLVGAILVV
jgi:uncharacterized membrane protein